MTETTAPALADDVVARVETAITRLAAVRAAVGRVVFGQETVVENTLVTLI